MMRTKKKIAMGLFFLLGLSTLVFGAFIFYVTYQLDNLDGRTVLMGIVRDTDEVPLEGVQVRCGDRDTISDESGKWTLNGVEEGLVTVEFYKDGFVRYTLKWLAYPLGDLGDHREESANNISYSLEESSMDDIMLKKEMEEHDIFSYMNGSLPIKIDSSAQMLSGFEKIYLSNGTGVMSFSDLNGGAQVLQVEGSGSFKASLQEDGPFLTGFHPVTGEINITNSLVELAQSDDDIVWEGNDGGLNVTISSLEDHHGVSLVLFNEITRSDQDARDLLSPGEVRFVLPPGVYSLRVYSRAYRDMVWEDIVIEEDSAESVEIFLPQADVETDFEDLSVKANYTLAVSYMVISLVLFFGGYYLKKGGSWAVLLILAFVGFLSKGLIDLYIFNINSVIAIILVIVLFSLRSEYNLKRQKMMQRKTKPVQ